MPNEKISALNKLSVSIMKTSVKSSNGMYLESPSVTSSKSTLFTTRDNPKSAILYEPLEYKIFSMKIKILLNYSDSLPGLISK